MYILKSGAVKILKKVKNQENTIAVLNPGEFFGEMALLDGLPRSAAVRATADSEVFLVSLEGYQRLRRDKPHTALKLMDVIIKVLSNRLRQANKNLEVISFWIE
jgi:CRP-like cAMP-binding protein